MATIAIDLCIIVQKQKLLNHSGYRFPISSWDPKLWVVFVFLKSHGKVLMTSAASAKCPAVWYCLTLDVKF